MVHARAALSACPTNRATPSYARLVESIYLGIIRANVDHPVDHSRGGEDEGPGGEAPHLRAGGGVEGIHVVVIRANVDHPVDHRWGGVDERSGGEAPVEL